MEIFVNYSKLICYIESLVLILNNSGDNALLVGDERGKVWVYINGQMSCIQKMFSAPVTSIQSNGEVVMVSTYSAIVLISREHLLGHHQLQSSFVELKVFLFKYLLEFTKYLRINRFPHCIVYCIIFSENFVWSPNYCVSIMWASSDSGEGRW